MKACPKPARKKKTKQPETLSDEPANDETTMAVASLTTSVIRKAKYEHMEIELQAPVDNVTTVDETQHFIIDDNITVESNIEIEFITSDELLPTEMQTDYEHADGNDFVDEIGTQQIDDVEYDDGNEDWHHVRRLLDLGA